MFEEKETIQQLIQWISLNSLKTISDNSNVTIRTQLGDESENMIEKSPLGMLLNSISEGLQTFKIENALTDHLHYLDLLHIEEITGRECFRSNDFAKIPNLEELSKLFKSDYPPDLEHPPEFDLPDTSDVNQDLINFLDNLDESIFKTFKLSEPEELSQNTGRKKANKPRKAPKLTKGGRGHGRKGNQSEKVDEGQEDEQQGECENSLDIEINFENIQKKPEETQISTKRPIPKSAKWMTREGGSAGRSNVQPPEILRCLFNELAANGLIMKSLDSKLAAIQASTQENKEESNESKMEVASTSESTDCGKNFIELAKIFEELAQKPIGRVASAASAECLSSWHESVDKFDNSWKEIYGENLERQQRISQNLTSLRSEFFADEVSTPTSELIVNPFASLQKDENPWEYLTQIPTASPSTMTFLRSACFSQKINVEDPLSQPIIQQLRESKAHPFVNSRSIFHGKVTVRECLSEIDFNCLVSPINRPEIELNGSKAIPSSAHTNGHTDSNEQVGIRTRKKRLNFEVASSDLSQGTVVQKLIEDDLIPVYWRNALTNELEIPGKRIRLNIDDQYSNLVTLDRPLVAPTGACFQFCVERATALLNLGLNIIVVDKTSQEKENREHANDMESSQFVLSHRIQLISSIIRANLGTIESFATTKSKRKKNATISRWGPILLVVKLKDLLFWEEKLQKECETPLAVSGRPVRLLSYYGNPTDRALIRSYLMSSSLYTEKSCCQIILTHYEALLSDISHFKPILWQMVVLDEGWSIVSNIKNKHLLEEINTLQMRHKVLSCSSLTTCLPPTDPTKIYSTPRNNPAPSTSYFPDIPATVQFLFPALWSTLEAYNELLTTSSNQGIHINNVELITKRLLQQFCASLTAICDEEISNMVHSQSLDSDEDTIQYYNIVESLPWLEWEGVTVKVEALQQPRPNTTSTSSYKIVYDLNKKNESTYYYTDFDIANEFNLTKMDDVGRLAEVNGKRLKYKSKSSDKDLIPVTLPSVQRDIKKEQTIINLKIDESSMTQSTNELKVIGEEICEDLGEEGNEETDRLKDLEDLPGYVGNENPELKENSEEMIFGKQAPPKATKRKIATMAASTSSTKPKAAILRHFEPDEELLRSVAMRGDRWQVSITFPGRLRFLGLYRSEETAIKAYTVALHQRRMLLTEGITLLPRIKFIGDVIGGFEGCVPLPSLGRKRKPHELLSEAEVLDRAPSDSLEKSIADMAAPAVLSGLEIGSWELSEVPPPAYAMLQGPKGLVAYLTNKRTILGKFHSSTIELAKNLGFGDPVGIGGLHNEKHIDVHLGDDPSIARQHAILKFNESKLCFEIEALHPLFVQGEKLLPGQPPVAIPSRAVIQIGCKIFYFVLPIRNGGANKQKQAPYRPEAEKVEHPSQSLRAITNVLLESVKLRKKGCFPDGTLVPDLIPSPEEVTELNLLLDELTRLQECLFPMPRTKSAAPPPGPGAKKRVRDEEMFMRSVISDAEKGIARPVASHTSGKGGQLVVNSGRMAPPAGGVVAGSITELDSQHHSQPHDMQAAEDRQIETDQHQPVSDEGIKYAKMPPALRPERPKKVEKPKGTPKPGVSPQSHVLMEPKTGDGFSMPRPLLGTDSSGLPYGGYPRGQPTTPYKYFPGIPVGPRGPLGPVAARSLPRPIYQHIRPPPPYQYPPAGAAPAGPRVSVPGTFPIAARPLYPPPTQLPRQPPYIPQQPIQPGSVPVAGSQISEATTSNPPPEK